MRQPFATSWLTAIAAFLFTALPLATATAADGLQALRDCAAIGDAAGRLACYDREVGRLQAAPAAGGAIAATAAAAPVRAKPEELFGLPPGKVSEMYVATPESEKVKMVTAKVTAVRPLDSQRSMIELDNGQQWRQVDTDTRARFKSGEEVTIKHNSFGSYWMSGNGHHLRVKRVR